MEEELSAVGHQKSGKTVLYMVIALVAVLLVFSAVQTFQINSVEKELVSGGAVATGISSTGASSSPPRTSAAPAMVGGC